MKSVDRSERTTERCKRTEEIEGGNAVQSADDLASLSSEETRQMLQELRVQKIELERQNDELRRALAESNTLKAIQAQGEGDAFETRLYPVAAKAGPVTQVAILSREVSDRITADKDLHHTQLLLNATQRLTRVGGWEWDVDAQSMVWTDETYSIHGYSPQDKVAVSAELIQRSLACYLPQDRPIIAEAFRRCAETGVPYDLRFPFVAVDGRQLWVRTMANPVWKDGRVILVRGNIMDITQQVEQEHHLRKYHNIVSSTTDAIAYIDSNYRYVLVNEAYERFSGIKRERFLGLTVAEYLGDTVFEKTVRPMFDRCLQGEVITYQQWFDYPALGRRYIDVSYFPYRNEDNRITGVIANSRDITDQIRIEEALRASEERFRFTFDYSPVGTAIVAPDFRFLRANSSLCRLVGYSEEELQSRTFADITHPEERERDVEQAQRLLAGEIDRYEAEKRYLCKHGGTVWAQVKVNLVRDADQQPLFFLPIIQDITARKEAERALAESESRHARIVETAQEGIWAMDSQRQTTYVNRHMAAMLGYAPEEMMGLLVEDFLFREDRGDFFCRVRDRQQGRGEIYENRFRHKNGRAIWAIVSATALQDEEGRFTGAFAMITDITERKETEIRIQQQADFNRRVLDSTPAHIAILDPQGIIIDINTPWNRFFMENNGSQAETIGRGTSYFCSWSTEYGDTTNAEQAFDGIRQVQRGERDSFTIDYPCHSPDEERWFSLRVFPLQGGDGKVLVSHTDISALKQTEKNLNAALAEKEVLLREVHHRVKNNLAAIISLLDMQRRSSEDRLGGDDLAELSGRIRSMSLIHEKLYQSENMARIDFEQYLKSLTSNLRTSFGTSDIEFHLAAKDVEIPLDLAVPCGMIINELMTNALKYAFPQGQPAPGNDVCRIEAGMLQKQEVYTLYVADNGVGLPPGFDWTTTKTLGMVLIRMLGCYQLNGRYAIDQQDGLRFTLTFSPRRGQIFQGYSAHREG
jgi:PAS domain S-box-containing protein